jgi:hypothetical protein
VVVGRGTKFGWYGRVWISAASRIRLHRKSHRIKKFVTSNIVGKRTMLYCAILFFTAYVVGCSSLYPRGYTFRVFPRGSFAVLGVAAQTMTVET